MSSAFDGYQTSYSSTVQSSIDFSGLPHAFFLEAKAHMLRDVIAERLADVASPSLIDIGCGVGSQHPYLRGLVGRIAGVDISAPCIDEARKANPWVDYAAYAGDALPSADASFDMALTVCVMHHVPPAAWPTFMAEMKRVVRPGGLVCVIEHNPLNPLTQLAVRRCEFDHDAVLLRKGRTEALMATAGLGDIETRFFLTVPSARPPARSIERLLAKLPLGAQYITVGKA